MGEWWRATAGVYVITNTVTNEQYIGYSADARTRLRDHRAAMRAGRHLNRLLVEACQTYGVEAFTFEVLERVPDDESLTWLEEAEARYIEQLRPAYNIHAPKGRDSLSRRSRDLHNILPYLSANIVRSSEDEMGMLTVGEACRRLGISHRTLRKWMDALNITATKHEYDTRFHMVAEEDVERIREVLALKPGNAAYGSRPSLPVLSRPSTPPVTPTAGLGAPRPRRVTRPLADDIAEMPPGAMAFTSWCDSVGRDHRTIERLVAAGRMPQPQRGLWIHPQTHQRIRRIYDAEQIRAAQEQL